MRTPTALILLAVLTGPAAAQAPVADTPCEGPDVDPWVTRARDRALGSNDLVRLAIESHGDPVGCQGEVTQVFDGVSYGTLRLDFPDGVRFTLETMPITTKVVELRTDDGFRDEEAAVAALRRYVEGLGYEPDWSEAEVTSHGGEVWESHWDPDPGLNTSATLIRVDGVLTGVRLSSAS